MAPLTRWGGDRIRVDKVRSTTAVLGSAYAWHNVGQLRGTGPVLGIDRLAGNAPFGIDPFRWVLEGTAQNPNVFVSGAPANGKSALIKSVLWWLVGAYGQRCAVVDVKGEYRRLAAALGLPVLDLRRGGATRVNPLDDPAGRHEFCVALASLCMGRTLRIAERTALGAALRRLPERPILKDLLDVLRDMPEGLANELTMSPEAALDLTTELRFALGELVNGTHAGMFDGPTTVDLTASDRGFVVDLSGAGRDNLSLALTMLVGTRAIDQMVETVRRPTITVNDEAWRLLGSEDLVRWMQYSAKIGREFALSNWLIVHRLAEVGGQADGVTGSIAGHLVADADTHIIFRQGEREDADDIVNRFRMPEACRDFLINLKPFQCLVRCRESPWLGWSLLTLETRMESCHMRCHLGSRPCVGIARRRRIERCARCVSSARSWAPITGR